MNAVRQSDTPWRIVRNPKICGGEPVIAGTRIPASSVVVQWLYYRDLDRVLSAFPHLDREGVECALDYYGKHKSEIDLLIEKSEQAANASV
jgi:uncharacterized protein (DUF433 family)